MAICLIAPALARAQATQPVTAREVNDYVFGGYKGEFKSPPSADGNPRRAIIVAWKDRSFRFVFSHEGSYCPWFELADGSGVCFQFFEGNDGWAELFNQFGRMEQNSFVQIIDAGPERVHIKWTYYGVNEKTGQRAYRGDEDFYALPNGLVVRRQSFKSLMPDRHEGYAREPIEMIGMCPVGKLWKDILQRDDQTGECHALAAIDPFSDRRYDLYWKPSPQAVFESTPRHSGADWKNLDDSSGVVMAIPMRAGSPFCVFGAASGYDPKTTRIKNHSFADTGGLNWVSTSWDHWPIGWLNSQAHPVDAKSLTVYPNHFSPAGMDLFALSDQDAERGVYWSLLGVGQTDLEPVRDLARRWLTGNCADLESAAVLKSVGR